jgi:hypothetical protein
MIYLSVNMLPDKNAVPIFYKQLFDNNTLSENSALSENMFSKNVLFFFLSYFFKIIHSIDSTKFEFSSFFCKDRANLKQ